jgi:subtilisin family serine protease
MALFDFAAAKRGRTPLSVDPLLRAAALAVVLQENQTEFGMMARIGNPRAICSRPHIRFGHAVRESDGTIIPPGSALHEQDEPVFAAFRIALRPDARHDVLASMDALSDTLDELSEEGWALELRGPSCSIYQYPPLTLDAPPQAPRPAAGAAIAADGAGVLIGAVDFGCAFAHPAFRLGDDGLGDTRLRMLWDQNGATPPGQDLPGRFHTQEDINRALKTADPYAELDYVPWENGYAPTDVVQTPLTQLQLQKRVHGTHVLSVAGGRRPSAGIWAGPVAPGVAPGAALAFVHLRPRALISEGDAIDVFEGVCAIFDLARREGMPAVVNLSVGANTGAHDGQGLMDRAFDALLRTPGRAITVAAGNMRGAGQHQRAMVAPGQTVTLDWRFRGEDRTPNILRIYAPMPGGKPALDMAIARPDSSSDWALPPGALRETDIDPLRNAEGTGTIGSAVSTIHPFSTEEPLQHFEIRLRPSRVDETWKIALSLDPDAATEAVEFDAWIERDDLHQADSSHFTPVGVTPDNAGCSLGSLACATGPICVGAYDAATGLAAGFSSLGPTRGKPPQGGKEKPDIAAPGCDIRGAAGQGGLVDGSGMPFDVSFFMSGTSAAAPQVAGIVALMLQLRPKLGAARIREILRETTQERQADPTAAWAHDLGCGRVDAAAALAKALEEAP